MLKQLYKYEEEGFPVYDKITMLQTTLLVRDHKVVSQRKFMNHWWDEVFNNTGRDQLSLMYLLWKRKYNNILVGDAKEITYNIFNWKGRRNKN